MENLTDLGFDDIEEMRRAFGLITGKWKLEILWQLCQRMHRFGELQRAVTGITQHMLTTQLRELEADGLISRHVYAEVPPRVEYTLMPAALGLAPVMDGLLQWSRQFPKASAAEPAPASVSARAQSTLPLGTF